MICRANISDLITTLPHHREGLRLVDNLLGPGCTTMIDRSFNALSLAVHKKFVQSVFLLKILQFIFVNQANSSLNICMRVFNLSSRSWEYVSRSQLARASAYVITPCQNLNIPLFGFDLVRLVQHLDDRHFVHGKRNCPSIVEHVFF